MSVDDRLRSAFSRQAESFDPAVEDALRVVARRRRLRWRPVRDGLVVAAASIAVVAGLLGASLVSTWVHDNVPARPAESPHPTSSALFGRYEAEVTSPAELAGHWVLSLNGNGTADVRPPPGYAGVVSGTLLSSAGTSLQITLFQQDLCAGLPDARLTWRRAGDRLVLDAVADPCTARRRFFTENTWWSVD